MHLFKLQYYVFGTGLGIFRLLHNLKSDCFDCVKFGSVCVKTSRPYSDSTFFGCLSKGFWVVSDYFITTSCLVESFSRLSKSREKSEKNILPVLNMTVLNNILLFTLFLLVSYFIANHFNVCFIKKIKKIVMNMCSKLQIFYWDILVNFLIMHKGCKIMFIQIDSEYLCWTWAALTRHAVMSSWTSSPSCLQSDVDKSRNNH